MRYKSVAVDGPSGAGKSTLAKRLAEALHFLYVDTGAIYRTVGLAARRSGVSANNTSGVIRLLDTLQIDFAHGVDGLQHMYLSEEDVTADIRSAEISKYTSAVSAIPEVRAFLMETQRELARRQNVVMDGRDIGTVVLPEADVKIFLTATQEARAHRRYEELVTRGRIAEYETVLREMTVRDQNDASRVAAPLRRAEDAILVDTTDKTLEQSFDLLLSTIRERL